MPVRVHGFITPLNDNKRAVEASFSGGVIRVSSAQKYAPNETKWSSRRNHDGAPQRLKRGSIKATPGIATKKAELVAVYLRTVPLLRDLTPEELITLGGHMKEQLYKDGDEVIRQGDLGDGFYIIKSGKAFISQINNETKEKTGIVSLSSGDFFGEAALLENAARGASVHAQGALLTFFLAKTKFQEVFNGSNVKWAKRRAISAKTQSQHSMAPPDADRYKTKELDAKILDTVRKNELFTSITAYYLHKIIAEMWKVVVKPGEDVLRQGELGDNFYYIESGSCDVVVDGEKVFVQRAGTYFGDLALMYNAPRSATVTAIEKCVLWVVDRFTFQRIVTNTSRQELQSREEFLKQVPLLLSLSSSERSKIAEALVSKKYEDKRTIIKQGDLGDSMYIIQRGQVKVLKEVDGKTFEVATLEKSKFFGERALLMEHEPRAATVIADGTVQLLALDFSAFTLLLGPLKELMTERLPEYDEELDPSVKVVDAVDEAQESVDATAASAQMENIRRLGLKRDDLARKQRQQANQKSPQKRPARGFVMPTIHLDPTRKARKEAERLRRLAGKPPRTVASQARRRERRQHRKPKKKKRRSSYSNLLYDNLEEIKLLGKGSFGKVTLVKDKDTGTEYALKQLSMAHLVKTRQQAHVASEKETMMELDHPFLVKLYRTFRDQSKIYFLLEPALGGELFAVLRTRSMLDNDSARFYIASVTLAFEYMHSYEIIYRDLKPENLLLDTGGFLKITDFGFAKKLGEDGRTYTLCGTPDYLAPEVIISAGHGKGVDWWCLGVLTYELLASMPPFYDEQGGIKTYSKIKRLQYKIPKHFSEEATQLIRAFLTIKPTERLGVTKGGATNIKRHAWFKGLDWNALITKTMAPPIEPTGSFDTYSEDEEDNRPFCGDDGWASIF